ncbi:patatin-like phospholipase family protein [Flavobacterium sp.]|uniref:patatin-like phospholipase family protein n=1 Tax=Flavobacterium sp. TaxID=239 RepID=UPI00262607B6|nr:patatin-like phospholipase family protein [Flavobacterium sp.]MDD3005456.1 patatin-like phospholipase family protein [Flavobacterium sp.]
MKLKFFLLLSFWLGFHGLFAQENEKIKIGLVLSGGGAKGLAHIGVLKTIEEAGVKIDYIGGTSMGAIVGGLYASGYNAAQIDSIFQTSDFDKLLKDYIPRSSKNFYEKNSDEKYALTLPFENFKVGIPYAYSKGLNIYGMFNRLLHENRHVRDFNELQTPFLCIATDIETGKQVVLNKGYLPQAIMASATFPSLFSPILINDKLLIDGGVANNYPIEEVKKMGANFIIGVDVQDSLKSRISLNNATRILVQISNLQMIEKMDEKRKLTDIYIKPDISDYTVISFSQGDAIIKRGEEASAAVFEKIKALGTNYKKPKLKRPTSQTDSIAISEIQINKLDNYTRAYVMGKLGFRNRQTISHDQLKVGIDNLNATQNFSALGYSFDKKGERDVLKLSLVENPTKTFLRLGLHFDNLYKSGVLVNVNRKNIIFKNDVASFDLILGDNIRYNFDYYIDNGFYWSFGFKSRYNSFNRNVAPGANITSFLGLEELKTINLDFADFSNQAYVQTLFKQKFVVSAGLELKNIKISSETVDNLTSVFKNNNFLSVFGNLKYDSLDDFYFPHQGWSLTGNAQTFLYSTRKEDFTKFTYLKSDFTYAYPISNNFTGILKIAGGLSIGEGQNPYFDYNLGGFGFKTINNFDHFYGYDFLSLYGDSFVKNMVSMDYRFYKKHHFNFAANYANIGNKLFDKGQWFEKPHYSGYALGYGLETILGPFEIKHSWSPETAKHYTWFSLGFWF